MIVKLLYYIESKMVVEYPKKTHFLTLVPLFFELFYTLSIKISCLKTV